MEGELVKTKKSLIFKWIAIILAIMSAILLFWACGVHYFFPKWRVERQLSKFEPEDSKKSEDIPGNPADTKLVLEFPLRLSIPSIKLDWVVEEASRFDEKEIIPREDLNKYGVVHYPNTVLPGEEGVCAIAGHRTTYGAPFWSLNELKSGDEVLLMSKKGLLSYKVEEVRIINSNDLSFLQLDSSILCLTACEPRFSSKQRICVICTLNQ